MTIRKILNKVPEVTIFFWIVKVLCTTVGETASDFINVKLNFGLTGTSVVMGVLLVVALTIQFRSRKYIPVIYWLNVVLISIFGTLVTDNLTDNLGVPLEYSSIFFSVALLVTFAIWYSREKTLSIHSIDTFEREGFYWLAVLVTFALGTATGDLMAEALGLGYATTGIIICLIVTIFTIAWKTGLNSILAFWVVYIMTRPLGASLGDFLTQSAEHGGLGLGPTKTTVIFVAAIFITVLYLVVAKPDVTTPKDAREEVSHERHSHHILAQVVAVTLLFFITSAGGYAFRQRQLQAKRTALRESYSKTQLSSPLGDLSKFVTISQAIFGSIKSNDWKAAGQHANDLEYEWDNSEVQLKPMSPLVWTHIDKAIDKVLRETRSVKPDSRAAEEASGALLNVLKSPESSFETH